MKSVVLSVELLLLPAPILLPQIVINELLKDPRAVPDSKGEWVELYNSSDSTLDLSGWILRDGGNDFHVIRTGVPLLIVPGGFLVLGRNGDSTENGGYTADYAYSSFTLSNEEDEVVLARTGGEVVDSIAYGAEWPESPGVSLELISPSDDNSDPASWGLAVLPFGGGDLGTPGRWNSISESGIEPQDGAWTLPPEGLSTSPYPNPSGGGFRISVRSPGAIAGAEYELEIFNVRGKRVRKVSSCCLGAGESLLYWEGLTDSGDPAPTGIYFYTVRAGGTRARGKLVIAR